MTSLLSVFASLLLIGVSFGLRAAEPPLASTPAGAAAFPADVRAEAASAPEEIRSTLLGKPANVARLAHNVVTRRSLAAEAERMGLDRDPAVEAQLRQARERLLAEARITQVAGKPLDRAALERLALSEYRAEAGKFNLPEEVRVRHILIDHRACDAENRIRQLREQAVAGADFAALARANSQDPGSASQGGDVGFFARGRMVPPFEEAAFALKNPGDLSEVVRTDFGFHIIRFEERRPPRRQPFEAVRDALIADIAAREEKRRRQAAVEAIERTITFDNAAIEAFAAASR